MLNDVSKLIQMSTQYTNCPSMVKKQIRLTGGGEARFMGRRIQCMQMR